MNDTVRPPMKGDQFTETVLAVQAKLSESVTRAGLQRDPYAAVIEAIVAALGTFPALLTEMRSTRVIVPLLTDKQVSEVSNRIVHSSLSWTNRFEKTFALRTAMIGMASLVVAFVIGGGVGAACAWSWLSTEPKLQCIAQSGGEVCFYWKMAPK